MDITAALFHGGFNFVRPSPRTRHRSSTHFVSRRNRLHFHPKMKVIVTMAMLLGALAVAGLAVPKPANEMGKRCDPSEVCGCASHTGKPPLGMTILL